MLNKDADIPLCLGEQVHILFDAIVLIYIGT